MGETTCRQVSVSVPGRLSLIPERVLGDFGLSIGGTAEKRQQLRDPLHCLCKDPELTGPLSVSCTSPRELCWPGCSTFLQALLE